MSDREIPLTEASLLLDKFVQERVPVVAFFVRDGVQVKLRGVVNRISPTTGIEIVAQQDSQPIGYLVVPIGNPVGTGCVFRYGETRELSVTDRAREEMNEKLGEAVLLVYTASSQLRLFFNP
jgi:hypothetical protein